MTARTLKALRGSIRKWQKIVAGTGKDQGPDNCPLCELFWNNKKCDGCPVAAKTGRGLCAGSPYVDYCDELSTANARRELAFLKSLLPKKKSK